MHYSVLSSTGKPERQISFELDASKSSAHLQHYVSQSSITGDAGPGGVSYLNAACTFNNIENSNNLSSPAFSDLLLADDNTHLKSVKLHHLNSFLSRSSSYMSESPSLGPGNVSTLNGSGLADSNQSAISSSVYNELQRGDQQQQQQQQQQRLSFTLNDTALEAVESESLNRNEANNGLLTG